MYITGKDCWFYLRKITEIILQNPDIARVSGYITAFFNFTLKQFHAIIILVENFDGMKLFLIGGMEDLNFNYCYKITYESGETYDRRRYELSVEISKEDYKKIITGVLQESPIDQIEGISDVIDKMTENVE